MTSRRINVKEAAAYLGVSKSSLDKWRMSPEAREYQQQMHGWRSDSEGPPFIRIGKRIVYDTASLDEWLGVRKPVGKPVGNYDIWDVGP